MTSSDFTFYCADCGQERDPQGSHRCKGWADTSELVEIRQEMMTSSVRSHDVGRDTYQPVVSLQELAPYLRRIIRVVRAEEDRQEDFFA